VEVRAKLASIESHLPLQWLWKRRFTVRLAGCFLFVTLATLYVRALPRANYLIWVANGVLLACLLLAPRRSWPAYLVAGFAAQATGCMLTSPHWQLNLLLTVLNAAEVLMAALLLRRFSPGLPRFADRAYLVRFIAIAALAAPVTTGLLYSVIAKLWMHTPLGATLLQWTVADGLGVCVATPACAAILRTRFKKALSFGRKWVYLLLPVLVSLAAFSQATVPLTFILYPLLVLVLLQMGMGWAAIATLILAGVGSWFTVHGVGPFASSKSFGPLESSILLQVFLASAVFMLYCISVVLESRRATERHLQRIVLRYALVTENSRDVIILAGLDGHRTYVSAASGPLSGWKPEELVKQGWRDNVHPEDWAKSEEILRRLRSGTEEAMIECRIRKRDGEYLWIESSLRTVCDPRSGLSTGILNIVRDITERKLVEKRLLEAYHAVEALAATDGLTGLANRRRFDQCLVSEWRRGMRERKPLSLLLIDADLFKSFNDTYGHLRGDSCLKQIADVAMDVAERPGDLVARFGGEEFAIILPDTPNDGAMRVASEICEAMRACKLPHKGNPFGIMTVSVGCATMVPQLGQYAVSMIELADEALYKAKRGGRNRACNGQAKYTAESQAAS
jgi:diguanylate cyclase (GGDEF)-like protein/PAS domain S-box-containing protein